MTSTHWDAIVIGGGAAGLSAAQALGRSLRRTLVIDGGQPRNRFADHMHNVLGLDGTPPFELTARGRAEAEHYGVEFRNTLVRTVVDEGATLAVHLTDGTTQHARAVIVATGITDVLPDIPGIAERWGRTVLHCPYCHGWEVRGRRLGVITTSPMSLHQARLVRQWSDDVTVFTAGIGDLDAAVARDFAARDVRIVTAAVVEVSGDGATVHTSDGTTYELDAVFTGGLMQPHDTFLDDLALERAETPLGSFIRTDMMQRTSHPRVFAAGNVINPSAAVPIVMATGMTAGAAVNAVLVDEDFALAEPVG